ncbi:MAG: hypothetical protein ACYS0D_10720, partial [Planctomycetota bacterium]|jgi:hypothetical protein
MSDLTFDDYSLLIGALWRMMDDSDVDADKRRRIRNLMDHFEDEARRAPEDEDEDEDEDDYEEEEFRR